MLQSIVQINGTPPIKVIVRNIERVVINALNELVVQSSI